MIHVSRKGGCRILLLILLLVLLAGFMFEKEQYLTSEGNCILSLAFVVKKGATEETIIPFYSESDDTYYLFLPSYSDTADVSIYFEGADRVVFEDEVHSLELKKNIKISELQFNKVYQTVFLKGSETEEEIQFVMMQSANLPSLFITTQSGAMESVDADKTFSEAGSYVLMDADGTLVYADDLTHITGRGNSTWNYPKKSYSIKLDDPVDMLGMGSARSWILLSNVEDNTYLRNKITYDMAVDAGMTGAPESQYIDLYINHEYNGMYLLCEKIEPGDTRIPMTDLGLENEKLNKEMELAEPVYTELSKGIHLGNNPKDISGGYIVERDEYSKYISEISGFQSPLLGDLYVVKSPDYASAEEVAYISGLFADMEEAVVSENGINNSTGESYLYYIDLKSFAQKYMIEEICKNNGGGATSSYFYKPEDAVSTQIFAGPVWDYDKAYGAVDGINSSTGDLCYLTQRNEGTALFWYLNQHPEFRETVYECYKEFFADYITKVLDEKIEENISRMRCSADMDGVRWREIYGDAEPYEQRVSVITQFLIERKEFLDQVWTEDAEVCTVHFVASEFYRDTYMSVIKGDSLTAIPMQETGLELSDRIFDGWYTEDGKEFDINQLICEDVTVYAASHEVPQ